MCASNVSSSHDEISSFFVVPPTKPQSNLKWKNTVVQNIKKTHGFCDFDIQLVEILCELKEMLATCHLLSILTDDWKLNLLSLQL